MIDVLLVICGITLGLIAGLVVYLKYQLSLIESYQKEISIQKAEQAKATADLAELHKATVEKYQKLSGDVSSLKADISGLKLHGSNYGVKKL